eukprot:scpid10162/ scgid4484/ Insulin receptor; XTK-1b; Xe-InsR; Insulin receptor subunit alpha; Insulin receptor subunit beta
MAGPLNGRSRLAVFALLWLVAVARESLATVSASPSSVAGVGMNGGFSSSVASTLELPSVPVIPMSSSIGSENSAPAGTNTLVSYETTASLLQTSIGGVPSVALPATSSAATRADGIQSTVVASSSPVIRVAPTAVVPSSAAAQVSATSVLSMSQALQQSTMSVAVSSSVQPATATAASPSTPSVPPGTSIPPTVPGSSQGTTPQTTPKPASTPDVQISSLPAMSTDTQSSTPLVNASQSSSTTSPATTPSVQPPAVSATTPGNPLTLPPDTTQPSVSSTTTGQSSTLPTAITNLKTSTEPVTSPNFPTNTQPDTSPSLQTLTLSASAATLHPPTVPDTNTTLTSTEPVSTPMTTTAKLSAAASSTAPSTQPAATGSSAQPLTTPSTIAVTTAKVAASALSTKPSALPATSSRLLPSTNPSTLPITTSTLHTPALSSTAPSVTTSSLPTASSSAQLQTNPFTLPITTPQLSTPTLPNTASSVQLPTLPSTSSKLQPPTVPLTSPLTTPTFPAQTIPHTAPASGSLPANQSAPPLATLPKTDVPVTVPTLPPSGLPATLPTDIPGIQTTVSKEENRTTTHIPTFPPYTGPPRRNWTVCSTTVLTSTVHFRLFAALNCDILNGTLVIQARRIPEIYRQFIRLPSLLHVTGGLVLFARPGWTAREILPNLIAVRGKRIDDMALLVFGHFLLAESIEVPLDDTENITVAVDRHVFEHGTDGIALLHGRVGYLSAEVQAYGQPQANRRPVDCSSNGTERYDVNSTLPEQCCVRTFNQEYLCPYGLLLACMDLCLKITLGDRSLSEVGSRPQSGPYDPRVPVVCRYYTGPNLDQCIDMCPLDTALFQDTLCLRKCPLVMGLLGGPPEQYYSVYNKTSIQYTCEITCPPFYQADVRTASCRSCSISDRQPGVPCRRECNGVVVKSLTQLCGFVGCTDVLGDLVLNINNPGLIPRCLNNLQGITTLNSAMMRALGSVRRVSGLLLVTGNICLYNLNFLHNLQEVTGGSTNVNSYGILINRNEVLTDVSGLRNLIKVGNNLLDQQRPKDVVKNFRITSNFYLCPSEIDKLFTNFLGDAIIDYHNRLNETIQFTEVLYNETNADKRLCPVTRFPIQVMSTSETSVTINWLLPEPHENQTVLYSQYLYYVETKNSVDPHLRDVIKLSGNTTNTDFSCAARLEAWSVIRLDSDATSYTVTGLRTCSEYAFEIDAFYNRTSDDSPGLNSGNSSIVVLGRPSPLRNLPAPGNVRVYSADAETIGLTWNAPNIACQEIGVPFTYRVFWSQINVFPPASNLTVEACGDLCRCSSGNFLDTATTIGQLLVLSQENHGGRFVLSNGGSLSSASDVPNLITPEGCNNTSVGRCCPEGVHVHVSSLNARTLFRKDESVLTTNQTFSIRRNVSTRFSTYLFSVQAYHGDPADDTKLSRNSWAVAANVSEQPVSETLPGFKVTRASNTSTTIELQWREQRESSNPIILYQVIMTQRSREFDKDSTDVKDTIDAVGVQCLMDHCAAQSGSQCLNISLAGRATAELYPVAVVVNISTSLLQRIGGTARLYLLNINCLAPQPGERVRDVLVQVRTVTLSGCGPWSELKTVVVESKPGEETPNSGPGSSNSIGTAEAIGIGTAGLAFLFIILLIVYSISLRRAKKASKREAEEIRQILDRMQQTDRRYFFLENKGDEYNFNIEADDWEVPLDNITLLGELGHGNFGTVYEGILKVTEDGKEEEQRVAVKTVNEGSSADAVQEFLEEACVMKTLNAPHLVNLVGLVTQGEAYAIMEFMPHGDLKHYLRDIRPEKQEAKGFERMVPSASLFHSWASHVAQGMDYLSGRKLVHRDLAARNIMIDAKYVLRVGDFGLARDVYSTDYYRRESRTPLPLRWLAPE